jgi:hypothetical protein
VNPDVSKESVSVFKGQCAMNNTQAVSGRAEGEDISSVAESDPGTQYSRSLLAV